jgi:hypothetical protein
VKRLWTAAEVADSVVAHQHSRGMGLEFWGPQIESYSAHWRLVQVPVAKLRSNHARKSCDSFPIAEYVSERRRGSAFPPILIRRPWGGGRKWTVWDGNHRVRAAQCVGDRLIAAFVPVRARRS